MTTTLIRPPILTLATDPTPVEKSVADGIADMHEPETLLTLTFNRPDGAAHVWYVWTVGGRPLGDRIDLLAATHGLDGADWIEISERNVAQSERGRISILAYPLRAVLGDIEAGVRARPAFRERFTQAVASLRAPQAAGLPWLGYGPRHVGA